MVSVRTTHPDGGAVPLGRFGLQEIDALRLLLRGGSVVDWFRLHFVSKDEIRAFLRVNELDPDASSDQARLADLHARATEYLSEHLKYRVPETIREADVIELFELASGKGRRTYRLHACLTLKVMHILHHVEAHELLSMLPISHAEVGVLLHAKVERVVRGLLERRFPIVDFAGSTKSFYSTVSKLLAKKDTQAAQVFDRQRFRIVVERLEDIPPLLVALMRELIPFNYVVPSQSENTLINADDMMIRSGNLAAIRADRDPSALNESEPVERRAGPRNEFSGRGFRIVNFVAQVPIRVDRVVPFQSTRLMGLGPIVFGTLELQVVDRATALKNETGENRHTLYKRRQLARVRERLERGKRKKGERRAEEPASTES